MVSLGIRTVAFLMLLAGASVGVLAGSLIARDRVADRSGIPLDAVLEEKVRYYREFYALDEDRTEQVRQALVTHKRRTRDALQALRGQHAATFQAIVAETEARLVEICQPAGPPDGPTPSR